MTNRKTSLLSVARVGGLCAVVVTLSLSVLVRSARAQTAPQPPVPVTLTDDAPLTLRDGVAIGIGGQGGRRPFSTDPIQAQIVAGTWQPPKAGEVVRLPDGTERKWEAIQANDKGAFTGRGLSYVYTSVTSPSDRAALLDVRGNSAVYVNGELRMGNPYGYEYGRLPVHLKRGVNQILLVGGRGELTARLLPVKADSPIVFNTDDPTLPDLLVGETAPQWGAVIIVNASDKPLEHRWLKAQVTVGDQSVWTASGIYTVPPWSSRKMPFMLISPPTTAAGDAHVTVTLSSEAATAEQSKKSTTIASATLPLRVMRPTDIYKRTFVSSIDGSVQYFGVNPAQKPSPQNALVLSLHGASVEALGQAQAYSKKDWATLIAPTNRRPYGFDWEDWGRLDGLEVLQIGEAMFPHASDRVVLTGHSMGGHGSWSVGSLFPDKFAAIGPSAGWISFSTYAGGAGVASPPPTGPNALIARGNNLSDTLARGTNLLQNSIYIVHGDADDNVPVEQERQMRAYLASIHHPDVQVHEEPGAGHWWDKSDAPGADCVDWAPMFALFEKARITTPTKVDFTTPDPAVSASDFYVRIEQQEQMRQMSRVQLATLSTGAVSGTTENVHRLTLLPSKLPGGGPLTQITLDGQTIPVPSGKSDVSLVRDGGRWKTTGAVSAREKNPSRGGGFKQAFQNRFVLLYGTHGTPEENAWAFARARYDAEAFWYRGNGAPDVLPDTAYTDHDNKKFAERNVILYGNRDSNGAWNDLLKDSPIQVQRGKVQVGDTVRTGDNLACLFLRPRAGSDTALVGAVSGSGLPGLRLSDRLPVFVSGVAYPDWVIADTSVLADATKGIIGAGYFGNDWKLDATQSAWRP